MAPKKLSKEQLANAASKRKQAGLEISQAQEERVRSALQVNQNTFVFIFTPQPPTAISFQYSHRHWD